MKKDFLGNMTKKARMAASILAALPAETKNGALLEMARSLDSAHSAIKKANEKDLASARVSGKKAAFLDRLALDDKRIDGMCSMLRDVASLPDPVGKVIETVMRPNGLLIEKVRVPIGVIGIIYESRPNVTSECVALCLKSGNSVILRGGSDALNSNKAIAGVLTKAAVSSGIPRGAVIFIGETSRKFVDAMLGAYGGIDLIMPRGGEKLISEVVKKAKVPVIKHYKGICHVYVDSEADLGMAEEICFNAKVQRPGVCNAMETMLVHEKIAGEFLPGMAKRLAASGVALKGCATAMKILKGIVRVKKATAGDYATEYLDLILNVRVVRSVREAAEHIARFGSAHSDAIVTESKGNAEEFVRTVDSAAVYVNASTRFTDGGEFGKGAEIGISTDKLHARGPIGLEELTSYKYVIRGNGQIRA